MNEKCACIILNYNDYENTIKIVRVLKEYKSLTHIVIVDNASTDDSFNMLMQNKPEDTIIIRTDNNGGYGYGNNVGVDYASKVLGCKYAIIANPDVYFDEDVIKKMLDVFLSKEKVGVVAPTQKNKNGDIINRKAWKIPTKNQIVFSEGYFLRKIIAPVNYSADTFQTKLPVEVDCVHGALLMVSTEAFSEIKGYDSEIFLYGEEITLGIRMKLMGYHTYLLPDIYYHHIHSASIDKTIKKQKQKLQLLLKSHYTILKKYYNTNTIELLIARLFYSIVIKEQEIISYIKIVCNRSN